MPLRVDLFKLLLSSYKVYTALLTQSGTDAPVATVLQNTLGVTLTFSYDQTGHYYNNENLGNAIIITNAVFFQDSSLQRANYSYDGTNLYIRTYNNVGVAADDILISSPVEIRVYP